MRETPIITTRTLSERAGTKVVLKAENLQGTGSFKLRGAMSKISALGEETARGVVCGSAGNHAQAVAYAARSRGVPCEVFMPEPRRSPRPTRSRRSARPCTWPAARSTRRSPPPRSARPRPGMQFIHPFDDADVISGQGGVGLELLRQVPDLARVVVPVGGGGLISGIAVAIRSQRPEVEVIGVQVEACAPFVASLEAGRAGGRRLRRARSPTASPSSGPVRSRSS